jgi:hypothetical protein
MLRKLGHWAPGEWKQTVDYTIPVALQFPDGIYPENEFMDHPGDFNTKRVTNAEYREKDRLHMDQVNDLRKAAECHR